MGFFSKLMKNPIVQMALPMALGYIAGPAGAALTKSMPMFQGMSPLMANALKQTAIGYGTSALSGSKRPWKGAMYAGLTSIPFSYMSAANAANAFNQDYAGLEGAKEIWKPGSKGYFTGPRGNPMGAKGIDAPNWSKPFERQFKGYELTGDKVGRVSPWDIATGKTRSMKIPAYVDKDLKRLINDPSVKGGQRNVGQLIPAEDVPLGADIFTKTTPGKIADGYYIPPETKTDWLPTAAAQAAALYGGRMTPEEEWEAAQKKRKKELAWMYGVDEDQIEGEMDNPWYGGGGYWNKGGIASLENGGDVNGPGTGTSDSIDAKLSDGEFVMTAKAVENLGGGDRYEGARKMYDLMNVLDPESETMSEVI